MAYTEEQLERRRQQSKAWRDNNKERVKETDKEYRSKTKQHQKERRKKHREENKEATAASRRRYRENNPEKVAIADIRRRYFLSEDSAKELYERSMGTCDSCGDEWDPEKYKNRRFCVDHDHDTGAIRGILCMPCNAALGLLKDDKEVVRKLLSYIEEYNGN